MTAFASRLPRRDLVRTLRWLTALSLGLALLLPALGAWVLLEARRDLWQGVARSASNLALALERDIGRNLAGIDLSLQGAVAALQQPGLSAAGPAVRHMALFDRAAMAEHTGALVVTDAEGRVLESSLELPPAAWQIQDRDALVALRERPGQGLHVSRPFRNPLDGEAAIALSRRRAPAEGAFAGIVSVTLRLAYFQEVFGRLDLGRQGTVALLRADGPLIARHPALPGRARPPEDEGGRELFQRVAAAPAGHFNAVSATDGVERLYAFRQVGNLPLVVSLGLSAEEIRAAWWHRAWPIGAILLALGAAIATLAWLFRREMLARIAAERQATEAADRLAVMATTDGLTGLSNRRQFDLRLVEEWRRAVRSGLPLSLLLLDTDHFKAFNDLYGSQEGDQALMSIAACLRLTVRRPADTLARYGGEEFAILLPETDARGAQTVAELIREAAEGLTMPHAGSPIGHATVSIGWACAVPRKGQAAAGLVEAADQALQQAKQQGRNRVVGAMAEGRDGVGRAA